MRLNRIPGILVFLILVSALINFDIYTMPFRFYGLEGYWHPVSMLAHLLAICLLFIPFMALFYWLRKSNACYLWIALFALPAINFGVVPIPFADYVYSSNTTLSTIFIILINIVLVVMSLLLYRASKK